MNLLHRFALVTGGILLPSSRVAPCPVPQPEPSWDYLRLVDLPWLSNDRDEALSGSQAHALELIEAGQLDEAAQVLRAGTWTNPEEELRGLIIHVRREATQTDADDPGFDAGNWERGWHDERA